jgi:hypothetical protein
MAAVYKILGQSRPANTSNADLYTVPASTETIVSTLTVSNVTGTDATIRIFVVPSGGTASEANALVYDPNLIARTIQAFTIGLTLRAGDKIIVRSGTANAITFQAFGQEIS